MRSRQRRLRPAGLAAGATLTAVTASAGVLAAAQAATAQDATTLRLSANHLAPGGRLTVSGTTASQAAGAPVVLQFAPAGATRWRTIARGRVAPGGRFKLLAQLSQSGRLRVSGVPRASAADPSTSAATTSTTGASAAQVPPSQPRAVSVGSIIRIGGFRRDLLEGQAVRIFGSLLPGHAGRRVVLQTWSGGHWRAITATRTGPRGGFQLRYAPGTVGGHALLVSFAGDRRNTAAHHGAGRVVAYYETVASWYDDGGATACGFHAGMGVANKYLPCGTKVTFRYHGRSVTAVVDDRGPYVGGRDFDLNQNVAGALGFDGVDTVWSTAQ